MIRTLRRAIKRNRTNVNHRTRYAQYAAAQARKKQEPLSYRQWREAMLKNSLPIEKIADSTGEASGS